MNTMPRIEAPPELAAFFGPPTREIELAGALSRLVQTVNIAIEGGNPAADILRRGADDARAVLWGRA